MVDEPEPPSKLLVDVMMFAMDEQPPAALVVVSAEEGLANGLNKLSQRGYRVVLIRPPRAALSAAGFSEKGTLGCSARSLASLRRDCFRISSRVSSVIFMSLGFWAMI